MALAYAPQFFYSQLFVTPPPSTYDFTGQTVIVTGANAGLGYEAALQIARQNAARVILAVRTPSKGEDARRKIESSTGRDGAVEVWPLDLSSFASVRAFAARAATTLERLDALLENAGVVAERFELAEGHESTVTTNVVSTFLLARLLLPKLRETAARFGVRPRLTIVSSEVHFFTNLPQRNKPAIFEALKDTAKLSGQERYGGPARPGLDGRARGGADVCCRYSISKLLEVLYCRELAAAMSESEAQPVTLNFLNPGFCVTSIIKDAPWYLDRFRKLVGRTGEVGGRTLVAGASAGPETHGQYMSDSVIAK